MPRFPPKCAYSGVVEVAGISAGVKAEADVNSIAPTPSKTSMALTQPSTWSLIWFIIALVYLLGIYFGMIRLSGSEG